jgi:glutaredoxin
MYIIYGSDSCRYCIKSKELLDNSNINYEYINITETKKETLDKFSDKTGNQRTLPLIFNKDNVFIGGYTELENIILYEIDLEF